MTSPRLLATSDLHISHRANRTALEAWLRNPPAEKDAYAEGKRGMPDLGLSADQIEGLVEFLMSTGQVPNKDVTIPATEVE